MKIKITHNVFTKNNWSENFPTITDLGGFPVGELNVWSAGSGHTKFNIPEKSWYKLRAYSSGFNGRGFPDLPKGWSPLYKDHRDYCDEKNTNISFWDWFKLQFPTARHFTDIQLLTPGIEFETVEEKEAFITWVLMKTIDDS